MRDIVLGTVSVRDAEFEFSKKRKQLIDEDESVVY